jgi:peptide-methionine (S)-S-oxide reductase
VDYLGIILNILFSPFMQDQTQKITFGGGCFWCVEAVFLQVPGVLSAESGYMGGDIIDPTYTQVCSGNTGHIEVVQVSFDPNSVSLDFLLEVFWNCHNPTTLNQQGNDIGTQYQSAIFWSNQEQFEIIQNSKETIAKGIWGNNIVTLIDREHTFYKAEDYHQNYFEQNQNQGYCQVVINPKVQKVKTLIAKYQK